MVSSRAILIPLVFIAGVAHAAESTTVRQLSNSLETRADSLSDILDKEAPECKSTCQGVVSDLAICQDAACICTQKNFDNLGSCLSCVVTHKPSEMSEAQQVVSTLASSCKEQKIDVKVPEVKANGAFSTTLSAPGLGLALVTTAVLLGSL
ncbi:hypothetical protein PQX77_001989 [Marasmius sp. AFHP31]|nr:hypothetical protein PQX77_001989 [Marasmius sp. AFHP31]